eukprot:g658.t1
MEPMKLFVYPPRFKEEGVESYWSEAVLKAAQASPRYTTDASEADVFLLGSEYACQLDWPAYTNDPPDANYKIGDKQMCPKERNERLEAYLKQHATHLECAAPTAAQRKQLHLVFDMMGYTVVPDYERKCKQPIAFAAPSFDYMYARVGMDLSWPAPPLTSFDDGAQAEISCAQAPKYRVVFKGTLDAAVRKALKRHHNGKDVIIKLTEQKDNCHSAAAVAKHVDSAKESTNYITQLNKCGTGEYRELLTNTAFGLVLRGDNLYSYRFLEVLSAGAIPVIFSDRWLLPFYEAVDYSKFAVVLREKQAPELLAILGKYSDADVCRMRRAARKAYRAYFSSFDTKLETAMRVFERRKRHNTLPPPIDWNHECRKCDCC